MHDFLTEIASGLLYGAVGIFLLALGFLMLDLLTPGNLGKLIAIDRNRPAAIVAASGLLSVGIVVTSSIISADGSLAEGLAETAGYGVVGIVMLGIAFLVIDLLTPEKLGDLLMEEGDPPVVWVTAAALLSAGAIVAAAIS